MKKNRMFYEDYRVVKAIIIAIVIILFAQIAFWGIGFIVLIARPIPEELIEQGFMPPSTSVLIIHSLFVTVFLAIVSCIPIALLVFCFKSKRLKYTITITSKEITFNKPIPGRENMYVADIKDVQFNKIIWNNAMVKIIFKDDIALEISTRKHKQLKSALDYLLEKNKTDKD